jgi:hypothetical protein
MKLKTLVVLMMPATLALSACQKKDDHKSTEPETPVEKVEDKAAKKETGKSAGQDKSTSTTSDTAKDSGGTPAPAKDSTGSSSNDKTDGSTTAAPNNKVDLNTVPVSTSPTSTAPQAAPSKPPSASTAKPSTSAPANSPAQPEAAAAKDPNGTAAAGNSDSKNSKDLKDTKDSKPAAAKSNEKDGKPASKDKSEDNGILHQIALPNYKVRLAPTQQSELTPAEQAAKALEVLAKAAEALPVQAQPAKDTSDVLASLVDDARLLGQIDIKSNSTLYKGKVTPKADAVQAINKEGKGVYCQTSEADKIQNGDSLIPFATPDIEKLDGDFVQTSTRMLSVNSFNIICVSKGKVTPMMVQENLKPALRFTFAAPDADLPSPGEAAAKPAAENKTTAAQPTGDKPADKAKEVPADQRAFKISNAEILAKVISEGGKNAPEKAMQEGKVVDVKESQKAIAEGKAQEACQVIGTQGKIDKNKVYKLQSLGVEAQDRAYKIMHYNFKADDQSKISFGCATKSTSGNANLKNAFKSILSFPASK